ncbi:glycoside hydrolase family 3 protein [Emericellopsis cladophorae]|uniref:Glycoside hydrolase family 3 protein n=1 Tax=Emericellopsis cladophorae TaxID=2686198 RepID=A0A9Q0BAZ8_9HYPO|nr:glycoside hydrolase family 3 protein [Emericellopsis cladophorae]KAI6778146.1 glycoside hydrolase family 3 protein [Emericellopsis cladophorae]
MCPLPSIPIQVINSGERSSDFVALMYVKSENCPELHPIKTLSAYSRLQEIDVGIYTLRLHEFTQASIDIVLIGEKAVLNE